MDIVILNEASCMAYLQRDSQSQGIHDFTVILHLPGIIV